MIDLTTLPDGIYRVERNNGNLIVSIIAGSCIIWNES
jgi:hypothetical protein